MKIAKKLSTEENLASLRKLLKDKITKNHIFVLKDGTEIDSEDEDETKINETTDGKNIFMKIKKDPNETTVEIYINNKVFINDHYLLMTKVLKYMVFY